VIRKPTAIITSTFHFLTNSSALLQDWQACWSWNFSITGCEDYWDRILWWRKDQSTESVI